MITVHTASLHGEFRLCGKEDAQEQKFCKIKAILYGMTAMLESGELPNDPESFSIIRGILEEEFQ